MKKYILLLTLLACTVISSLAQQPDANGILYVKKGSAGIGNSWANALGELAEALKSATVLNATAAGTVTQIWVAAGTYLPLYPADAVTTGAVTTTDRKNAFVLVKDVQLYGGFAGTETVLNGRDSTRVTNTTILSGNLGGATDSTDNAYHVVIAANVVGTAAINSFVITGGVANGGSVSVNGVSILGDYGGGMTNTGRSTAALSSPAIANITLTVNAARIGGGMCNSNGSPAISNTIISNNVSASGGGGGGMANLSAAPVLNNVVINGNQAPVGGGIYNAGALNPRLTNVRMSGNQATSLGGGIFNDGGSVNPVLINVTISGNSGSAGGAIYNNGSARSTISNSIIYGNSSGLFPAIPAAGTLKYSLVQGVAANATDHVLDGTTIDPLFNNPSAATAPFTDGDYSLKATSPVIDSGSNGLYTGLSAATTDLAGNARVTDYSNGGSIDLGAYEYPVPVLRPDANGILYVKKGATGGGNNWANALGELADALKAAQTLAAGTVTQIWVAGGTYYPMYAADFASPDDRDKAFVLVNNVKVYGGFAGTETTLTDRDLTLTSNKSILSGDLGTLNTPTDNAYHVVVMAGAAGTAEFNGFTVTAGYGNRSGSLLVNGTAITGSYGGGMELVSASPVLANMEFLTNTASSGGALALYSGASATIQNTVFKSNTATNGGAVYINTNNTSVFDRVAFSGNNATSNGGAMYLTASVAPVFKNVQITGNKALANGGAAFISNNSGYTVSFLNTVISGNASNNGGIYTQTANIIVQNSIIYGNSHGIISTAASDPNTVVYSLVQGVAADAANHIMDGTKDPLFVSATSYTSAPSIAGNYALQHISPVINKGNNTLYAGMDGNTIDLAGNARVYQYAQSGTIDMGAFEYQGVAGQTITVVDMAKTYGAADFEPGATASSDLAVNYASADNTIAEPYQDAADGNKWKIKIKKAGTVNITASQPGDTYYNAATNVVFALTIQGPDANGVIYVKKGSTGAGNSWANALGELADALKIATTLNSVSAGTVTQIWVAAGTYLPLYPADAVTTGTATTTDRKNAFVLVKDVQLYGGFAGTEMVLSGRDSTRVTNATILSGNLGVATDSTDNAYHVVIAANVVGTAAINSFVITGGVANGGGVPVNGVTIPGDCGGGMANAGIPTTALSSPAIVNITLTGNATVRFGGGMYNNFASPAISNTIISNNFSGNAGGGIFNLSAVSALNNVVVSGNQARYGGGIGNSGGSLNSRFTNVSISGNRATSLGGAIFNDGGSLNPVLTNVTISGNVAPGVGAAIYNYGTASATINNSIIYGNSSGVFSDNYPSTVKYSLVQGVAANATDHILDGTTIDPQFNNPSATTAPFADGDYSLKATSPVIDSGSNSLYTGLSAATTDLAGNARVTGYNNGGIIDMGAYEYPVPALRPDANGILYVKKGATGNGNSWANAVGEVSAALRGAAMMNTTVGTIKQIWVAKGTYLPAYPVDAATTGTATDTNRYNSFVLVKDVKIYGGFAGNETDTVGRDFATNTSILSGDIGTAGTSNDNAYRVVVAAGEMGEALISGFTISDAYCEVTGNVVVNGVNSTIEQGGGITVRSAALLIEDVVLTNNYNNNGAGAACYAGSGEVMANATFRRVTILRNSGKVSGAGIYAAYANVQIENTTGSFNTITSGGSSNGGMFAFAQSATVHCRQSSFNDNRAAALGGAIYATNDAVATFYKCEFLRDSCGQTGGAFYTSASANILFENCAIKGCVSQTYVAAGYINGSGSNVTFINSQVTGNYNTSSSDFGIFRVGGGNLKIINTTISGNNKSAIAQAAGTSSNIFNSIIYGNGGGITGTGSYNALYSTIQGGVADAAAHITNTDPLFANSNAFASAPFTGGDYSLQSLSPVVNAGYDSIYHANDTITTDLGGNSRFAGSAIDQGAYEQQQSAQTITTLADTAVVYGGIFTRAFAASSGLTVGLASADNSIAEVYQDAADGNVWKIKAKKAGTVTITMSQPGDVSFAPATNVVFTLTINKAPLSVTAKDTALIYTGTTYNGGNGVVYSGFVNGDDSTSALTGTLTYSGNSQGAINANTYVITPGGLTSSNYSISFVDGQLDISKAAVTVAAVDTAKVYNGLPYTGGRVTYTGLVNNEQPSVLTGTVTYNGTSQNATNVGTYVVTPGGLTSSNYSISFVDGQLDISKAGVTVTAVDTAQVYNGLPYTGGRVTYTGLVNSELPSVLTGSVTYSGTSQNVTNVGTYVITPGGLTSSNYSISFVDGQLDVNKAGVTVTAVDTAKVYNGLPYTGGRVTYTGLVNNEQPSVLGGTVTYSGTSQNATNVGTYVVTPGGLTSSNYSISFVDGQLDISKAGVTVTAVDTTKVYNGLPYTGGRVTYTGLVNSELPSVLTGTVTYNGTSQNAKNVGAYVVTPGGLTSSNYSINFVDGQLDVNKAGVTVTAVDTAKVYNGMPYTSGRVIYTGLVNNEQPSVLTGTVIYNGTSQNAKNVGTYVITPGGLTSSNYSISFVDGQLDISKAGVTVTAVDTAKVYNGLPYTSGRVIYTGLVNSELPSVLTGTVTYSGTSQNAKNVGAYVVTPGGLTSSNYSISFVDGQLDISKAGVTVTAVDTAKVYNGLPYTGGRVTYTGLVNSELPSVLTGTVTYNGTSQNAKNVGAYVVTPGGLTSSNYSISFVDGQLDISKAGVTVTAVDTAKVYDGLPYTGGRVTYTGLVNNEQPSVLTGIMIYAGTSQNATNVGTYVVTPGGLTSSNYSISFVDGQLDISKAGVTVTAVDTAKVYNGLPYTGGRVTYTGLVNNEQPSVLTGTMIYTGTSQNATNVGTYVVTPGGLTSSNYSISFVDGQLDISKAGVTVTAVDTAKVYNGLPYTGGRVTFTGLVNNEQPSVLTGTVTYSGTSQNATNVGTYVVTPGGLSSSNYSISFVDAQLDISKAGVTVTAVDTAKMYDGLPYTGGRVTYTGLVNNEQPSVLGGAVTYNGTSQGATNVGTYVVTPGGLTSSNYSINFVDGQLDISKAGVTVTAVDTAKVYNGLPYTGGRVTYTGLVNSELPSVLTGTVTYNGTSQNAKNVGAYVITPGGLTSSNYNISFVNGQLDISKAGVTVTAVDTAKVYDGLPYTGGRVTFTGLVNSELPSVLTGTVTYSGTSQNAKNVGTYVLTPGGLTSSNYSISFVDGQLDISKAGVIVTAVDTAKVYNGLPYTGGRVTYIGLVNNEQPSVLTGIVTYGGTSQNATNVGTYVVTPGGLTSSNYSISFVDGQLDVNKAGVTVTAVDTAKVYNGLPYTAGRVTYTGLVNNEQPSVLGGAVTYNGTSQGATNVGTYVITPGGLTSSNYNISFIDGQFDISKAAVTITAVDTAKVYNGLPYTGGRVTFTGLVNNEQPSVLTGTITYSGTSQNATNVGTYIVTPGGLTSSNYSISFVDGQLDISKAGVTVTAIDTAKVYNGLPYTGGRVTYTGLVNNEQPSVLSGVVTYSGTSQNATNVGTYVVTPGGLTSSNYSISFVDGQLNISKASVTVTAVDTAKVYDGLAYTSGRVTYAGLVNNEQPSVLSGVVTYSGTSQNATNVGTYIVTPGGLTSSNYSISFVPGQLDISKAGLSITPADKERCYGVANPGFTFNYNGFVHGETVAVLTALPVAATTATIQSAAGDYVIVPSGATAANYAITYTNGTLTVNALPVSSLSATQGTILCGVSAQLPVEASGVYSFVWSLNNGSLPGNNTGMITATSPGVYTAVATDAKGCVAPASNSITLTQLLPPQPAFSYDSYCAGKPITFTNESSTTGSGPVNFTWNSGNGETSTAFSPKFSYNSAGNYTVTVTATPQICPSLVATVSKIIVIQQVAAGVRLNTAYVPAYEPAAIQGRNMNDASYTWQPGTALSNAYIYNPLITLNQDQTYLIQMTFPSGCMITDTLLASVFVNNTMLVPNVFSPNGDRQNDELLINLRGVKRLNYFRVFNRTGKKLFETADAGRGWDGRYNGELQPLATYVWTAEGVDNDGRIIHRQGTVTLLR